MNNDSRKAWGVNFLSHVIFRPAMVIREGKAHNNNIHLLNYRN